jgi:hypothetical protein
MGGIRILFKHFCAHITKVRTAIDLPSPAWRALSSVHDIEHWKGLRLGFEAFDICETLLALWTEFYVKRRTALTL